MAELRRLRYFLAVAQERNFTRAAERLHIAQPALSRQIRQLEQELGVRLLERTTQFVEPTEAGRLLMARGADLCEEADRLWRDVRSIAGGESGSLAFGYSASTGYETAPVLLAALSSAYPDITTSTRLLPTAEVVRGVADGSLDAGLVRCPPPTPQLVRTLVRLEPQGVLMHEGHRLAGSAQVTVTALAEETVLVHARSDNPGHYDAIAAILDRAKITPRLRERQLSFDAAHLPVAQGGAVSIVGESALPGLPAGLVWRPLTPTTTIEIHLLTRGIASNPATATLQRVAAQTARAHNWLRSRR